MPITAMPRLWSLPATSRTAERAALAGDVAPGALMARAGMAVARLALATAPHAQRVLVWAGPGNNGGDGLVAARLPHLRDKQVQVTLLGDPNRCPPDAAQALLAKKHEWHGLAWFPQSRYKCDYFGMIPENFGQVLWR